MTTVTGAAKSIKMPSRYIRMSDFFKTSFDDDVNLDDNENIPPSLLGSTVDYLTRFIINQSVEKSFEISWKGYRARVVLLCGEKTPEQFIAEDVQKKICIIPLLKKIKGLDDDSIISACKCTTYDLWYRNPSVAKERSCDISSINPNEETIQNIRTMVNRGVEFFKKVGPVVCDGFKFKGTNGISGYSNEIVAGDGDFLTSDAIWDFKVLRKEPSSVDAVQLLLYWIMGQHTWSDKFKNIDKVGIFNPRLNKSYVFPISNISSESIRDIEDSVIKYKDYEVKYGDRVNHNKFGNGTVISASPLGDDDAILEIRFDESGTKKLAAKFAKITQI